MDQTLQWTSRDSSLPSRSCGKVQLDWANPVQDRGRKGGVDREQTTMVPWMAICRKSSRYLLQLLWLCVIFQRNLTTNRWSWLTNWLLSLGSQASVLFEFQTYLKNSHPSRVLWSIQLSGILPSTLLASALLSSAVDQRKSDTNANNFKVKDFLYLTGILSSAIQLLPELQKVAGHLYSYQRTPAWVTPRGKADQIRVLLTTLFTFYFWMKKINLCTHG